MDLLAQYSGDSGDGDDGDGDAVTTTLRPANDLAPAVHTAGKTLVIDGDAQIVVSSADVRNLHDPAKKKIYYNAKYEDLHAPLAGPAHPFRADGAARGARNHATGHVETAHLDRFAFEEQYNTFHARGYGANPDGAGVVGDAAAAQREGGDTVFTMSGAKRRKVRDDALARVADGAGDPIELAFPAGGGLRAPLPMARAPPCPRGRDVSS